MSKAIMRSVLLLHLALGAGAWAQDGNDTAGSESETADQRIQASSGNSSIQLKTTSITGSRELPKVLVIVPWKSSEAMGPGERPLSSLVEEALTPVDPDVFRRQLSYYTKLQDATASKSSGESKD